MWSTFFQRLTGSSGPRRGGARRAVGSSRLAVERLELRSLLSAVTPWQNDAATPHWEDAAADDDGGWEHHAPPHYDAPAPRGDAYGISGLLGNPADAPPASRLAASSRTESSPATLSRPLALRVQSATTTYVIYVVRTSPAALGASSSPGSVGGDFAGGDVGSTSGRGDAGGSKPPAALTAPPGAKLAFDPPPLRTETALAASTAIANVLGAGSPAARARESAAARRDDASPLLRALESRDAVFRALASVAATRTRDLAAGLTAPAASMPPARRLGHDPTDESEGEESDRGEQLTLRELTEAQSRDIEGILRRLAAHARAESAGHAARPARGDAAESSTTVDVASGAVERASAADAALAAAGAVAPPGGMILLHAADEADGPGGALAVQAAVVDEALAAPLAFDAAVGSYRALAVGVGPAPAAETPAATATSATSAAIPRDGKGPRGDGAASGAATAIEIAGAAIGATVLAARAKKSRNEERAAAIPAAPSP
jgi:hypothetical protein